MWSFLCSRSSFVFFSSRRRHTRFKCDWSSDVCSSDLTAEPSPLVLLLDPYQRYAKPTCPRSEEHTSELQSHLNLVCRLLLEQNKKSVLIPDTLDLRLATGGREGHRAGR